MALTNARRQAVYAELLRRHRGLPIPFGAWRADDLVAGIARWLAAAVRDLGLHATTPTPAPAAGFLGPLGC